MILGQLHPFVLHFAVALLLAAPACDSFGLLFRREALLQAIRINPRQVDVHRFLADYYRREGDAARAEWHAQRAVR